VAGGTGWAPIWSLAAAARHEQRHRDLLVIAGARDPDGLYMSRALDWLIDDGVREVIATAELDANNPILPGRPTHYLPALGLDDTVYVAGPPGLVDAVKRKAREARSRCYADPFLPGVQKLSLVDRVMQMLRGRGEQGAPAESLAPRPVAAAFPRPPVRAARPEDVSSAARVAVPVTTARRARERSSV
jgi:3-phenylpropionate/trans-cinnamate dioxygenase ferredoxin reductase subunit